MNIDFIPKKDIPDGYIDPICASKQWETIFDVVTKNDVQLDLFTIPFVTEKFCQELIKASEDYGKWTTDRHERYPTYDMLISSFGWWAVYDKMFKEYAFPVANHYWQMNSKAETYKTTETFIVKYEYNGQQTFLAPHIDTASYTTTLTLNDDFEGGGTYYTKHDILLKPKIGTLLFHPEINYRHGARAISSGVRYVLITFHNHV